MSTEPDWVAILQTTMEPDLTKGHRLLHGSFVLGSIWWTSFTTSTSSVSVWQCMTHLYPAVNNALCSKRSKIASCASNIFTPLPMFCVPHTTKPVETPSSSTPVTLMRMFSPGNAYCTSSASRKMLVTLMGTLLGMSMRSSPLTMVPASSLPRIMVPMSRCLSRTGIRTAMSRLRSCGSSPSRISKREGPPNQGHISLLTRSLIPKPMRPDTGEKVTSRFVLYPHCLRKGVNLDCTSS
mmetsp:Transcript_10158/g.17468  ORF Transcript_10158/g.17468 Transcript_10158/m.17468 type:complete len:238 (+) Transcript_10158:622-1335(+)